MSRIFMVACLFVAALFASECRWIEVPYWETPVEVFKCPSHNASFSNLNILLHDEDHPEGGACFDEKVWSKLGGRTFAISMPGHGSTGGSKCFAKPKITKVLSAVIEELEECAPEQIYIFGFGKGALEGILLSCARNDITILGCINGNYTLHNRKKFSSAWSAARSIDAGVMIFHQYHRSDDCYGEDLSRFMNAVSERDQKPWSANCCPIDLDKPDFESAQKEFMKILTRPY